MTRTRIVKLLLSASVAGSATAFCISNGGDNLKSIKPFLPFNLGHANAASPDRSFAHKTFPLWNDNWDKLHPHNLVDPRKLEKAVAGCDSAVEDLLREVTPTATRHLLFIRHGQYESKNKEDEKRVLTPLGQEQAVYTGIRLKELGINYDRIVESSMTRAIETSLFIQDQLKGDFKVERTDLLREGSPIEPEPPFRSWRPEYYTFRDGPRIEAAFRKYVHRANVSQKQDSYEVFVCHANVIRYVVCRALQLPPEAWLRMSLRHGSITWISIRPNGRVSLKCLGEASHIPVNKLSVE